MQHENKTFDVNAHIENLQCQVVVEGNRAVAYISFTNLGYGDITAIKFHATGYNSFGDIVPINNQSQFILMIQDILISKNQSSGDIKILLPSSDIRQLDLEEIQVCYNHSTVVAYLGKNEIEVALNKYDNEDGNGELLSAIRTIYDNKYSYQPVEVEHGWVCACGRYNPSATTLCSLCGNEKTTIFRMMSPDGLSQCLSSYRAKVDTDEKASQSEMMRANQRSLKQLLISLAVGLILIIVFTYAVYRNQMSKMLTFDTVEEMQDTLEGVYTYYNVQGDPLKQLNISEDIVTERFCDLENFDFSWNVESWDPTKGTIQTDGFEIVFNTNGTFEYQGDIYEPGGVWEYSYNNLKIVNVEMSVKDTTICRGAIRNLGDAYCDVEIKVEFEDKMGNVVLEKFTNINDLAPGQTRNFSVQIVNDTRIRNCTASIEDVK